MPALEVILRTTYTWDPGPSRVVQPIGCGYPVNIIYDDGTARVLPMEPMADQPAVVVMNDKEKVENHGKAQ